MVINSAQRDQILTVVLSTVMASCFGLLIYMMIAPLPTQLAESAMYSTVPRTIHY